MNKIITLLFLVFSINSFSECVHERSVLGHELRFLNLNHRVFIKTNDSRFVLSEKVKIFQDKKYTVQLFDKLDSFQESVNLNFDIHAEYNKKFLEYYTYARIQKYIRINKSKLEQVGFNVRIIGQSIEGRNLYAITPKVIKDKKTILMFGRHHGDEGTANWIIEGFLDEYIANATFREHNQLFLYPMINPDGAEAHTRYNANGRDLNRSWHKSISSSFDEIKIINKDVKRVMSKVKDHIYIALDMHGSFTKDFIYRVNRNYVSPRFYNMQQSFIDSLGMFDVWQNGNFQLSNGNPAMARIVLINSYGLNAMTHESVRNIKKNNSTSRSIETLKLQGKAIVDTLRL